MEFSEAVSPRRTAPRILMVVVAVALFFMYAYLPMRSPWAIFNSPDEMANFYFTRLFAEEGRLTSFEPLEEVAGGRIHPRSIVVRDSALLPESFHGLPVLYGIPGKIFRIGIVPYLTAIIAVLAAFAWRRVVGQFFGARAGTIAALLLAATPAWWYWTGRSLYHNVLFTSLLIFAAYFFITKPFTRTRSSKSSIALSFYRSIAFDAVFAGIALGFAWWVRTSELGWTAVVAIILLIIARKILRAREVTSFIIAAAIAFTPALIINNALYGSPLRTGYTPDTSAPIVQGMGAESSNQNSIAPSLDRSISFLIPFGLHPRTALTNFTRYFVTLPWWMTFVTVLSLLWFGYHFLRGNRSREETTIVTLFLGVTGWLAAVYGSWVVHDNPNPDAVTIGISYSRYWLPAFLLSTSIAGIALSQWFSKFKNRITGLLIFSLLGMSLFVGSFRLVFFSSDDGLVAIRNTLRNYSVVKEDVLRRTPRESVIVVDHADKIFFPDRRVTGPLRDEGTIAVLGPLSLRVPLYYYGVRLGEEELKKTNEERLEPQRVQMELVTTYPPPVPGGRTESLYEFVKK